MTLSHTNSADAFCVCRVSQSAPVNTTPPRDDDDARSGKRVGGKAQSLGRQPASTDMDHSVTELRAILGNTAHLDATFGPDRPRSVHPSSIPRVVDPVAHEPVFDRVEPERAGPEHVGRHAAGDKVGRAVRQVSSTFSPCPVVCPNHHLVRCEPARRSRSAGMLCITVDETYMGPNQERKSSVAPKPRHRPRKPFFLMTCAAASIGPE